MNAMNKDKEEKNYLKPTKPAAFAIVVIGLIAITLSFRPVRAWVCEKTYVCFRTCENYTKNPNMSEVHIKNYPVSCEVLEMWRQKQTRNTIGRIFGEKQVQTATGKDTFSTEEITKDKSHE